jgi:GMP synthase (glutamine-hydrolysing)
MLAVARLLVLATGNAVPLLAERRGDFDRWIREQTGDAWKGAWAVHDVRTDAPLPRPSDAAGFVITGSSSSVTERAPWMLRTEALIRGIAAARVPLLGICFGHQMIAQALGGDVQRNPRGREIGTVRLTRVLDDPLFAGLPRQLDVNATHVDSVAKLPPHAEVLATTALDPVAAFRVGDRVKAVQFHPEFDADAMRGYLVAREERVREEGLDPEALMAGVHPLTRGADILRSFAQGATAHFLQSFRAAVPHEAQPSSPTWR